MGKTAKALKQSGIIAILVVVAGGAALYTSNHDTRPTEGAAAAGLRVRTEPKTEFVTSTDKKTVSLNGQTGKTALQLLQSMAHTKTEHSSFGEFVTVINGIEADGIDQLWAFYVDGKLVNEEAQTYQTTDGEHIEWRVESI